MNTAVVVIETPKPDRRGVAADYRASARFLAQLIAAALQAPQTRARRRAQPNVGAAAYVALTHAADVPGRNLRHSI